MKQKRRKITTSLLAGRIRKYETKLLDPKDPDDKRWTSRRLEKYKKRLEEREKRLELKSSEKKGKRR